MRFIAGQAENYPAGHTFAMLAMAMALRPSRELIVCAEEMPKELKDLSIGNFNILYKSSANAEELKKCAPFTESYPVPKSGASWYLCENGVCHKAVGSFGELEI